MRVRGGEGVEHQQRVLALRQQPLQAELQLGSGGGLEVPHAGGTLGVGATERQRAAGQHLPVMVAVWRKNRQHRRFHMSDVLQSSKLPVKASSDQPQTNHFPFD